LIENGDIINVDVEKRRIDVQLTDEEMELRRKKWTLPAYKANRGVLYKVCGCLPLPQCFVYITLMNLVKKFHLFCFQYIKNVQSASRGCVTDE
jgi:dihydroxy-acid dehydratase